MASASLWPVIGELYSLGQAGSGRGGVRDSHRVPAGQTGPQGQRGGTYTSFQGAMQKQNLLDAKALQQLVGGYQRARRLRPEAATGRLYRVTMSPKNIQADKDRIGVGMWNYLDNSQAKYWRTIEVGSAVTMPSFVGTKIFGSFIHAGRVYAPQKGFSGKGTGFFHPYQPGGLRPYGPGIVKHHIRPSNAYKDAWNLFTAGRPQAWGLKRVRSALAAMASDPQFGALRADLRRYG